VRLFRGFERFQWVAGRKTSHRLPGNARALLYVIARALATKQPRRRVLWPLDCFASATADPPASSRPSIPIPFRGISRLCNQENFRPRLPAAPNSAPAIRAAAPCATWRQSSCGKQKPRLREAIATVEFEPCTHRAHVALLVMCAPRSPLRSAGRFCSRTKPPVGSISRLSSIRARDLS
jgi:hypothetical protein